MTDLNEVEGAKGTMRRTLLTPWRGLTAVVAHRRHGRPTQGDRDDELAWLAAEVQGWTAAHSV